jgi:hypothetical protein
VGHTGLNVKSVQRHAKLLFESPETGQANSSCVKVVMTIYDQGMVSDISHETLHGLPTHHHSQSSGRGRLAQVLPLLPWPPLDNLYKKGVVSRRIKV